MEREKQVCSLELAKKLKGLDVEQESNLYWVAEVFRCGGYTGDFYLHDCESSYKKEWLKEERKGNYYPAFTASELGEMLPGNINEAELRIRKSKGGYAVYYGSKKELHFFSEKLTNAMAKMLIYLKENNLIKE